jgi:hypothetical protein
MNGRTDSAKRPDFRAKRDEKPIKISRYEVNAK